MPKKDSNSQDLLLNEDDLPLGAAGKREITIPRDEDIKQPGVGASGSDEPLAHGLQPAARDSDSDIALLAAKLAAIAAQLGVIEKRGWNDHFKYHFLRASDVVQAIRGKLAEQKIILLADVLLTERYEVVGEKSKQQGQDVVVRYTFLDGDTGARISFRGAGSGLDSGDKAIYKALTGALKYALTTVFLIADDSAEPESAGQRNKQLQTPREVSRGTQQSSAARPAQDVAGRAGQSASTAVPPAPDPPPGLIPHCSQGHGPMVWVFPSPKAQNQWQPFFRCKKFPACAEKIVPPLAAVRQPGVD